MGVLCLFGVCLIAGNKPANKNKKQKTKKDMVYILNSDETMGNQLLRPDITVLQGNVKLRHKGMYMYCDSAFLNEKTNSFEAFGKVHMEQGDTLFVYGNYLKYDGFKELANLRENVKLVNRGTTLLTDSLDYDRVLDKA
jgi:lipopolysaccharide assembly outer membrane protein LptD (OstA)